MLLAQTIPYLRRRDRYTSADQWGAVVAHQDLVRAALERELVEGVHFFVTAGVPVEEMESALAELREDFPGARIEVKRLLDLPHLAERNQYAAAVELDIFGALAHVRQTACQYLFPITGIVHTIAGPASMMQYFYTLLLSEPFDAIVATSEAGRRAMSAIFEGAADYIARRLRAAAPPKIRVVKIPLGVDEQFLCPRDQQSSRQALDLPLNAVLVLYLGRLTEEFKADLEPLLAAFRHLSEGHSAIRLVIAGKNEPVSGPDPRSGYATVIRGMAAAFGISDRVIIRPNIPFSQKALLYSACDIFVSPVDNVQETFGLTILEAMAAGLPVVASDWSGYRDLVSNGETGFLAPTVWNADAAEMFSFDSPLRNQRKCTHLIAQQTVVEGEALYQFLHVLAGDAALRERMGSRGRKRVLEDFSWPVVIRQHAALWREQWETLEANSRRIDTPLALGFNEIYGHYATGKLGSGTRLRTVPGRCPLSNRAGDGLTMPIAFNELEAVLATCASRPTSIKELIADGNATAVSAAAWLWKKGYLQCVYPSDEGKDNLAFRTPRSQIRT